MNLSSQLQYYLAGAGALNLLNSLSNSGQQPGNAVVVGLGPMSPLLCLIQSLPPQLPPLLLQALPLLRVASAHDHSKIP